MAAPAPATPAPAAPAAPEVLAPAASAAPAPVPAAAPGEDGLRIATLVILFFTVIFFWVAFYQNAFALTLFAERSTRIFSWLRPETYQFFEPFFILALTPLLLLFFGRLQAKGREPSTPVKIFFGMLIMAVSMVVMVFASLAGGTRAAHHLATGGHQRPGRRARGQL